MCELCSAETPPQGPQVNIPCDKNVLVGIGKFIFPVDFIILDLPEDVKGALDPRKRPFLVYALRLRERMELNLEATLMGETLVLNRSLDPLYGDYIELNDLNVPLELKRDQVDDFIPTIESSGKYGSLQDQGRWEILFLENRSAKLHVWKQEGLMGYPTLSTMDLAGKEIDKVGEVSIIWNLMCAVVMLVSRRIYNTHSCS
ncbi:hypothetical protein Tco_0418544 [Tanacetum coccineum]